MARNWPFLYIYFDTGALYNYAAHIQRPKEGLGRYVFNDRCLPIPWTAGVNF